MQISPTRWIDGHIAVTGGRGDYMQPASDHRSQGSAMVADRRLVLTVTMTQL